MVADVSEMGLKESLQDYVRSVWNQLDLLCLLLFCTGLPMFSIDLDFAHYHENEDYAKTHAFAAFLHEVGRVFLVFSLLLYIIRLLNIFTVHKLFGPKLIMLGKMVLHVMSQ